MKKQPTVFAAIPTGYFKEYAALYMLASLRALNYPKDRLKITFYVTIYDDPHCQEYKRRLESLIANAEMPFNTTVKTTLLTQDDFNRWGPYSGVIRNLHQARVDFLAEPQWQRFWVIGGDNPPSQDTLAKLVKRDADIVSPALCQRPAKCTRSEKPYIVLWDHNWMLEDIPRSLEPRAREQLRTAWIESGFLRWVQLRPSQHLIRNHVFGSGCSLIKREVMEYLGYSLGAAGTHSEDLHFGQLAISQGFTTLMDMNHRCLHYDEDGLAY